MTFSILGRCAVTARLGMAVASSSPAVAARCAHGRAGVGVVATQNVTDPSLGPRALDLLAQGVRPAMIVEVLQDQGRHMAHRQLAILDANGWSAVFSGSETLGTHQVARAEDCVAAGNLLATVAVPKVMVAAFGAAADKDLGQRLLAAMQAGLTAGGEAGPIRSAGLLLFDRVSWPVADLRVDWHEAPLDELAALWKLWQPQMEAYVARALDPDRAPAYGVPGDP